MSVAHSSESPPRRTLPNRSIRQRPPSLSLHYWRNLSLGLAFSRALLGLGDFYIVEVQGSAVLVHECQLRVCVSSREITISAGDRHTVQPRFSMARGRFIHLQFY